MKKRRNLLIKFILIFGNFCFFILILGAILGNDMMFQFSFFSMLFGTIIMCILMLISYVKESKKVEDKRKLERGRVNEYMKELSDISYELIGDKKVYKEDFGLSNLKIIFIGIVTLIIFIAYLIITNNTGVLSCLILIVIVALPFMVIIIKEHKNNINEEKILGLSKSINIDEISNLMNLNIKLVKENNYLNNLKYITKNIFKYNDGYKKILTNNNLYYNVNEKINAYIYNTSYIMGKDKNGNTIVNDCIICDTTIDCNFKGYIELSKNLKYDKLDNQVKLDSTNFEDYFDISSKDKIMTMQIFTSEFMNELGDLYGIFNIPFGLVIKDNHIYIYMTYSIYPTLIYSRDNKGFKYQIYKDYMFLKYISSIINLFYNRLKELS